MAEIRPVTSAVRLLSGKQAVFDDIGHVVGSSSAPVTAEVFFLATHPTTSQLGEWASAGRQVDLLLNHHVRSAWSRGSTALAASLEGAGVGITPYAPQAFGRNAWLHSKLLHLDDADEPVTWLHNSLLQTPNAHTDLGVVVGGEAARAARAATEAARDGDPRAMADAIDLAAGHGILLNDPVAGRWYASDAIQGIIERAHRRLDVTVKALDHPATTSRIVAAHRRGAEVTVAARDIAPVDAGMLLDAGIPTASLMNASRRMHHNVVGGDGLAYVGSAYPWAPMRGGDDLLGHSRDAGVLLAGDDAADAVARSQAMVRSMDGAVDLAAAGPARDGLLITQRDWVIGKWPNVSSMTEHDVERAVRELDWEALGGAV